MKTVDMSANAVAARIRRIAELRRVCLSLGKAKLNSEANRAKDKQRVELNRQTDGLVPPDGDADPRKR